MVMNKELYSLQETSKILGVSVLTLQRWDKEGKITAIRTPSDRRRFPKSEINRLLDDRLNDKSVYEELTNDLLSIVTSFSGRLYGTRSGKNKMLKDKVKVAIKDVANLPNKD